MSVENLDDPESPTVRFIEPKPACCFYCGTVLPAIVVYWRSNSSADGIAMHGDCARRLGGHLVSDADKLALGWPV